MELLIFYILPFVICIISIFILDYFGFPFYFIDIIMPFIPILNIIWALMYVTTFIELIIEIIIRTLYKIYNQIHKI